MCAHSCLGVGWSHLPLARDSDRAKRKREHAKLMTDAYAGEFVVRPF
jgi:hypothetical protein